MDFTLDRDDAVVTVGLVGRLDGNAAKGVHEGLAGVLEEGDRGLLLDMSRMTFISSAGLRIVLIMAKQLDRQGGNMALYGLSDRVREVFRISGFDTILDIAEDRARAWEMVEGGQPC